MPRLVDENGIRADAQYLGALLLELAIVFRGFFKFRRADKREISWVEEQHEPLASVVGQFNFLDLLVVIDLEFEVVDFLADLNPGDGTFCCDSGR